MFLKEWVPRTKPQAMWNRKIQNKFYEAKVLSSVWCNPYLWITFELSSVRRMMTWGKMILVNYMLRTWRLNTLCGTKSDHLLLNHKKICESQSLHYQWILIKKSPMINTQRRSSKDCGANPTFSEWKSTIPDVSQGSIFRPLLLKCFLNDLCCWNTTLVILWMTIKYIAAPKPLKL